MGNKERNRHSKLRKEENIVSIYFDSKRGVKDASTEVHTSWVYARTCVSAGIQWLRPRCVEEEVINQISRLLEFVVPLISLANRWSQSTNDRRVWREKQYEPACTRIAHSMSHWSTWPDDNLQCLNTNKSPVPKMNSELISTHLGSVQMTSKMSFNSMKREQTDQFSFPGEQMAQIKTVKPPTSEMLLRD